MPSLTKQQALEDVAATYREVLENARQTRGEAFAQAIEMHQLIESVRKLQAVGMDASEDAQAAIEDVMAGVVGSILMMYSEEVGLSVKDLTEAVKLSKTLSSRLDATSRIIARGL